MIYVCRTSNHANLNYLKIKVIFLNSYYLESAAWR